MKARDMSQSPFPVIDRKEQGVTTGIVSSKRLTANIQVMGFFLLDFDFCFIRTSHWSRQTQRL